MEQSLLTSLWPAFIAAFPSPVPILVSHLLLIPYLVLIYSRVLTTAHAATVNKVGVSTCHEAGSTCHHKATAWQDDADKGAAKTRTLGRGGTLLLLALPLMETESCDEKDATKRVTSAKCVMKKVSCDGINSRIVTVNDATIVHRELNADGRMPSNLESFVNYVFSGVECVLSSDGTVRPWSLYCTS